MTVLSGRRALVTGAARGMGRAHAVAMADLGASVFLVDLDQSENEEAAAAIQAGGGKAFSMSANITDRSAAEAVIDAASEAMGGIDILVHNAGLMYSETGLADTDDQEFAQLLAINLYAPLYLTRAALPHLEKSEAPRVIFISSQWGQVPDGHSYGYMTSKAGQLGLMKTMAKEFAAKGILVNAVAPGAVMTRLVPESYYEVERQGIPIGRLAEPSEISAVVAFLASDGSSFITGQTIPVNGGACIVGI